MVLSQVQQWLLGETVVPYANKEQEREHRRIYRLLHHDRIVAYAAQYRKSHRAEVCEYNKRYRRRHPDRIAAYAKGNGKQRHTIANRRYRENHPEKYACHKAVQLAVKRGDLVHAKNCERCGKHCSTEAHHSDYSKPMQLTWLCLYCHLVEHGKAICDDT